MVAKSSNFTKHQKGMSRCYTSYKVEYKDKYNNLFISLNEKKCNHLLWRWVLDVEKMQLLLLLLSFFPYNKKLNEIFSFYGWKNLLLIESKLARTPWRRQRAHSCKHPKNLFLCSFGWQSYPHFPTSYVCLFVCG